MIRSLFCGSKRLLHDWGKWKDTKEDLRAGTDGTKTVGHIHVQERTCEACGFTERHVQRIATDARISS